MRDTDSAIARRRQVCTAADIDRARAVRIESIIAARNIALKRIGNELVGPCPHPYCAGRDRFSVNRVKQCWNCRGCQRGGDVIDLVRHLDGCDFRTAVETLTGNYLPVDHEPTGGNPKSTVSFETTAPFGAVEKSPVSDDTGGPNGPVARKSVGNNLPVDRKSGVTNVTPDRVGNSGEQKCSSEKRAAQADDYSRQQRRKAAWLWQQRQPIKDTVAEKYLRHVRGYHGTIQPTLAFLAATDTHHAALISAFGLAHEAMPGKLKTPPEVHAVHLTLLKPDGTGKADVTPNKKILGSPVGCPIVIAQPNDLLAMGITEGIEDALSVHAVTGLGTWAAGNASLLPALADAVPSYIECVTIFAHNDANGAGQRGAAALAERLSGKDIEVLIAGDT